MAALLVVDRTMMRSLWASAQRIAAVVLGMSVAWVVGSWAGVNWWSMGPVIFFALLLGRWSRLGDHGMQVPAMVLLSLLTVGGTNVGFTYLTILETLIGGVIGVLTNAVVLAPLHLRRPREQVAALARQVQELVDEMAGGLRNEWRRLCAAARPVTELPRPLRRRLRRAGRCRDPLRSARRRRANDVRPPGWPSQQDPRRATGRPHQQEGASGGPRGPRSTNPPGDIDPKEYVVDNA